MIVKPLHERRPTKPVAFVLDARNAAEVYFADQNGLRWISLDRLRRFDGYVYLLCWPSRILSATDYRQWSAYKWRKGYSAYTLDDGPTFYPFNVAKEFPPERRVEAGLLLFRWLMQHGVIPGSLASMGSRLWRSTLDTPIFLPTALEEIQRRTFYGGRKEAPYPGSVRNVKQYDITAAYPHAMGQGEFPTKLVRADATIGEGVGMAEASVIIPEMEWSPLPDKAVRNIWTWTDLRLAQDTGCDVTVHTSWTGDEYADLFGEWWAMVADARRTVQLSKYVTSQVWGQFALRSSPGWRIRWNDAYGNEPVRRKIRAKAPRIPTSPIVAAEISARVRSRLYREGMAGNRGVVYVDTDGIIADGGLPPDNVGDSPGQWRMKAFMPTCEIKAPQCYRFTLNDKVPEIWHYSVAGFPPDSAERIFHATGRTPERIHVG